MAIRVRAESVTQLAAAPPRRAGAWRMRRLAAGWALLALIVLQPGASPARAESPDAPPESAPESSTAALPEVPPDSSPAAPNGSEAEAVAEREAAEQAAAEARRNPDPWEPFNRAIFQVNEWGDIYLVKPMAQGWRFLTPSFFRDVVTNFNTNLQMPVILANNVLQLKPTHVRDDFLRFFFNLTFGLGGLVDMGTMIDIPQNDEDFGQTLGYWGVPSGPYLVLPVYGPSTVRDGVGRLADSAATLYFSFLPFYSTLLVSGVDVVNLRSFYIEEIDANRVESFDYYVFLRNAYLQNRRVKVASRRAHGEDTRPDESLYDLDDDLDEDFDEDAVEDALDDDALDEDLLHEDGFDDDGLDEDDLDEDDFDEESPDGGDEPDAGALDG